MIHMIMKFHNLQYIFPGFYSYLKPLQQLCFFVFNYFLIKLLKSNFSMVWFQLRSHRLFRNLRVRCVWNLLLDSYFIRCYVSCYILKNLSDVFFNLFFLTFRVLNLFYQSDIFLCTLVPLHAPRVLLVLANLRLKDAEQQKEREIIKTKLNVSAVK